MYLSLETLASIIRANKPILVELIDLVNSVITYISIDLTQMVNSPTRIPHYGSHSPDLMDLFLFFLTLFLTFLFCCNNS